VGFDSKHKGVEMFVQRGRKVNTFFHWQLVRLVRTCKPRSIGLSTPMLASAYSCFSLHIRITYARKIISFDPLISFTTGNSFNKEVYTHTPAISKCLNKLEAAICLVILSWYIQLGFISYLWWDASLSLKNAIL
jgi:hypothetical protein